MPRNVEIKARLRDRQAVEARAAALAETAPEDIQQHDTFFAAAVGRLKLRRFQDGRGELVFYDRPDVEGPKTSRYRIYPAADAAALTDVLTAGLTVIGEVRKERRLYLVGRTRVHLDRVDGLGDYLELEVVLRETESEDDGEAEAGRLLDQLGVALSDRVSRAYVDLLAALDNEPGIP